MAAMRTDDETVSDLLQATSSVAGEVRESATESFNFGDDNAAVYYALFAADKAQVVLPTDLLDDLEHYYGETGEKTARVQSKDTWELIDTARTRAQTAKAA
jgi:nucleoside phosphorylase